MLSRTHPGILYHTVHNYVTSLHVVKRIERQKLFKRENTTISFMRKSLALILQAKYYLVSNKLL